MPAIRTYSAVTSRTRSGAPCNRVPLVEKKGHDDILRKNLCCFSLYRELITLKQSTITDLQERLTLKQSTISDLTSTITGKQSTIENYLLKIDRLKSSIARKNDIIEELSAPYTLGSDIVLF